MESAVAAVGITFIGGALYRWARHSAWRVCALVIVAAVIVRMLTQSPGNRPEEGWLAAGFLFGLPLLGAFVIGLIARSRLALAAKGGAILLSKNVGRNVDTLVEVSRQHDDSTPRR